jgi:hypothetical protein
MDPLHEVRDEQKLQMLVENLSTDGWKGVPLVIDGEQLLTDHTDTQQQKS